MAHHVHNAVSADTKNQAYGTSPYDAAGSAIMSFTPINQIHQHLCAFHAPSDDRSTHVRSHHFCTHLRKDLHQCVVYDSDRPGARLIGIEYIVPHEVYDTLPKEEKRLWHSHKYEVESGMLVLGTKAGIPEAAVDLAEQPAMLDLHKTYGKTVHTWPSGSLGGDLPIGAPQLMMSYTADDQLPQDALDARDSSLGVSTSAKRKLRTGNKGYLPRGYEKHPEADSWEGGRTLQLELVEREGKSA